MAQFKPKLNKFETQSIPKLNKFEIQLNKLSNLITTSTGLLYHLGMTGSEAFTEVLDLTAGSVASPVNFQATLVQDALVLMVESDIMVC